MILEGEREASPADWVEWSGKQIPITFPAGFYATFESGLAVRDPGGHVVATAGEDVNVNPQQWSGLYVCAGVDLVRVYLQSDVAPESS